ncbi:MAG TPA: hypothetical protein ENN46_03545 [Candidatus Woesearchaeota archaeon]|nr:hypothetical protein [Candidatus Woesearchaeota archaeon]
MDKKVLLTALLLVIAAGIAFAQSPSGTDFNREGSETWEGDTATSTPAQGGNVTELTISQDVQTRLWQAFYGNLTGEVALKDSAGTSTVYDWGALSFTKAYVFMTRLASVDWTNITGADVGEIEAEDVALSMDDKTEAVNKTKVDGSAWDNIEYGTENIAVLFGINMASGSGWRSPLLYDGTNDGIIYSVYVNTTGQAFNSQDADYQIIVPTGNVNRDYYVYAFLE